MSAVDILGPIPAVTNYCTNPSFETNTTGWSGDGGTLGQNFVTEPAQGLACGSLTITSTAEPGFRFSAPFGDAFSWPVVAGDRCAAAGMVKLGSAGQRTGAVEFRFFNSSNAQLSSVISTTTFTLTSGVWTLVSWSDVIAPAGTAYTQVRFYFLGTGIAPATNTVVGDVFYLDMVDFRKNVSFDAFVSGSQGAGYAWLGTAENSPSTRVQSDPVGVAGVGGQILCRTTVYQSDALGKEYDELTDYVIDGEIGHDIDRDFKGTCRLVVTDPVLFPAFSWVKIYQTVEYETSGEDSGTFPVGLFRLSQPASTWMQGTAEVSGVDPTIQLNDTCVTTTYNIVGGTQYTKIITSLLESAGFAGRYSIPDDARVFPADGKTYFRGTSYLTIINDLLVILGYYTLYALPDGTLTSKPYVDRLIVEPTHVWRIGQDAEIIGEIQETVNDSDLYNYVVVTRMKTDTSATVKVAENRNPAHPFSTVSLGKLAGLPKVYRQKSIAISDQVDDATLQAIANEVLQLSSMLRYVTVGVLPHPTHIPHEVADMQFDGTIADELTGRYYIESSSSGLVGSSGTMVLKARRVESYDG